MYIFTKNWGDLKTSVYAIPTKKGKYVAVKKHSLSINCMLTSIDYNTDNNMFIATAYNDGYESYLITIKESQLNNQDFQKLSLFDKLGNSNQLEAIAWKNDNEVYVTREASNETVKGKKYDRKQKLIEISLK